MKQVPVVNTTLQWSKKSLPWIMDGRTDDIKFDRGVLHAYEFSFMFVDQNKIDGIFSQCLYHAQHERK